MDCEKIMKVRITLNRFKALKYFENMFIPRVHNRLLPDHPKLIVELLDFCPQKEQEQHSSPHYQTNLRRRPGQC